MRFYSFTNANYMSQLQLGLQTAHCVAEVAVNAHKFRYAGTFGIWAKDHKTIVILDGGNCESLKEIEQFFSTDAHPYVWSSFYEDEASLNGAITSVGIVLPEEIYETAKLVRSRIIYLDPDAFDKYTYRIADSIEENGNRAKLCHFYNNVDPWTENLIELLNSCRLA